MIEAGIMSVMPSYNEIDGVPSHANKWLLQKVLREEWGFNGHVVSDYYAIPQMMDLHHVAADKPTTAKLALEAGVDTELPDPGFVSNAVAAGERRTSFRSDNRPSSRAKPAREVSARLVRESVC